MRTAICPSYYAGIPWQSTKALPITDLRNCNQILVDLEAPRVADSDFFIHPETYELALRTNQVSEVCPSEKLRKGLVFPGRWHLEKYIDRDLCLIRSWDHKLDLEILLFAHI